MRSHEATTRTTGVTAARRKGQIATHLLAWFADNARDLPWRRTKDPYAVWVSEIMLQQTRVDVVIPYYERFLARFSTVAKLARARLDTVLKVWEGLGYYSRARHMHAAAKTILRDFSGRFPHAAEDLRTLPGIGPYTAGAIASIAFGQDEPAVDGNVTRVLCRLMRIHDDPRRGPVRATLWRSARGLLPPGRAGAFNQALMELGATICLPRTPLCHECPLQRQCLAKRHGEQDKLPATRRRKAIPTHIVVVGVVYRAGKILIDKRKPQGLLGGLWEFPGGKAKRGESLTKALLREIREELGITVRIGQPLVKVRHAYSHFAVTIHAFQCEYVRGRPRCVGCTEYKWVRPSQLDNFAFPAANRKIIAALTGQARSPRRKK